MVCVKHYLYNAPIFSARFANSATIEVATRLCWCPFPSVLAFERVCLVRGLAGRCRLPDRFSFSSIDKTTHSNLHSSLENSPSVTAGKTVSLTFVPQGGGNASVALQITSRILDSGGFPGSL